ncbi:MAG TPA: non-ribosomal peptide synthetase, partial [Candidatus Binatia bacterium]|nr:non-ribosomal peptide synthetase [Candidatus Binatia bacterium]
MSDSLGEFFLENFQAHRHERAYGQRRGYRIEWFTYGQVLGMAERVRAELAARGIGNGDRVMLWGENSAQWVAAFIACAMSGVTVVPMDDAASADFAARVAAQVQARLWIRSKQHVHEVTGPVLRFEDIAARHPAGLSRPIAARSDDTLQIVFTSGTTAEPKGVVITHANVLANVAPLEKEIRKYLKYERWVHPVRFLNLLPLSHVFGQFLGMFLPPLLGGIVIFQQEMRPGEIIDVIRRERVSVLVSVPRVLQSLKQKIERDFEIEGRLGEFRRRFGASENQHFLRRWWGFRDIHRQFGWKFWAFISGGAALDSESENFWQRLGYAAIQGYGLTETTSLISVNHPFKLGRGSIGKVLPGRDVKLAADGEILVRGAGVASGYWERGERREVADGEGWYRTGDVGALDGAGNLYFKGRKKDVIVTPAGLNIYPEDLEAALRRQPEIKDCVVVGLARGGNAEPCAVVIMKDSADAASALARANESLADFQHIRMWVPWPEQDFPRTSTQKPRRNVIAAYASGQVLGTNEATGNAEDPVRDLIGRITGRKMPSSPSSNSDLQSDLGLSSLERVELIGALEDRYQIDLGETSFAGARTLGDIEKMLRGEAMPRVEYHYPAWALRWPVTWLRWLAHWLL